MIDNTTFRNAGARFTQKWSQGNRKWIHSVLAPCAVVLCLSACGNSEDSTDQQLEDESVAAAQNTVKEILKASGMAQENADGELTVGLEKDGESVQMGQNLPVPEWLPNGFPLPTDLSINMVAVNLSDEKTLEGRSATVALSDLVTQVTDWSAANNWELITANTERIITVSAGGDVIDVRAEDGVGMQLEMSKRSVTWDRQRSAVEVVSPGIAAVTLGEETFTLNGECKIKGSTYGFEYTAPDGSTSGFVNIQSADSEPQGSATLQTLAGGDFNQYTISFPMDNDDKPTVQAAGREFSVEGTFGGMGSIGMQAVPGVYTVKCE